MKFDDIVKVLQEHKDEIMGFGVEKIGIFGSYAKGCNSEKVILIFWLVLEKFLKLLEHTLV